VAGVLLLAATVAWPTTRVSSQPRETASEADIRDQDIAFYEARVARDPDGALDRAMLGTLFLQRARETGDFDDLVRAETVARESFQLRSRKNEIAVHVLATSLIGQHRYGEALEEVTLLVGNDDANHSYQALMGEIEMELGRYTAAESTFADLRAWRSKLTVAPRLARWEELNGNVNEARTLLETARDEALRQPNLPAEQKAWFHLRVGDLAFRYGRTSDAERAWQQGLALSPTDHRLLASMSRLELSRLRWKEAIRLGEAAIARSLDPATLGLMADAYTEIGDTTKARDYARTMELVVLAQPGAYHRAWALYLLDHDRQVAMVLENIRADMMIRKDIYGYDLLAWALHKNGHPCEARQAMRQALALGTRDPLVLGHAEAIARTPCPSY
jgi:predicted Zn-dependent protease